jgi:uncharacterized protein
MQLCYNMCNCRPPNGHVSRSKGMGRWSGEYLLSSSSKPIFMVRFDVSSLTKAPLGTSLTLDVDTGPQDLTDLEVDFIRGTIEITRVQGGVLVQGTLSSRLERECVRCLAPSELSITLNLEETFRLPGTSPQIDTQYEVSENGRLDLTPILREQGWLAIPMKPLCHPDCRGLCPQCGANLNQKPCTCERMHVDPRLAALRELL